MTRLIDGSAKMALAICLCGATLLVAPPRVREAIRTAIRDASQPGLLLVGEVISTIQTSAQTLQLAWSAHTQTEALQADVQAAHLRERHWQVTAADLQQQLASQRQATFNSTVGTSSELITSQLVSARILAGDSLALWRKQKILGVGRTQGLVESSLVLEDTRPLLDVGADFQLQEGQPVYSGGHAVGRIVRVGRWTSVLQSVTDPQFRGGMVELARETSLGLVFGSKGLLEGAGEGLCRVNSVSSTEAVSVGQHVYSADHAGDLPGRVYFGKVVSAELTPGSPHWKILVRPELQLDQLEQVSILLRVPNPERIAASDSTNLGRRK